MPILEDGQLFERYRVHKWLGGGVAGESYEAEDRILQRKVTLKLIHPWTTLSDSARRHFFREMQGISLLNHPYLATVLDYGEVDGRIYVARRYVSSGSLLSTNGRSWFHPPLPVRDAFEYVHQLAQALQYIHQHGHVHGSLTFANVLVLRGPDAEHSADYTPFLVADAGLAHFVRRFGQPRMETLPVSAAPEQLAKRLAPASDQFALAVLLYFWLAGRPPYLGTSTEIEQQKLSETITPLSILNPGITLEQDSVIMRALMAYPEDRHSSVLAFAEALNASLTSAIRIYATPLNPFTPQPETPREILQEPENAAPAASTQGSVQLAPANSEQPLTVARDVSQPTQPVHSALEDLLAKPQEVSESRISSQEMNDVQVEQTELVEEVEIVREEIVLFPTLPETPRVDESILQAELVATISDQSAPADISSTFTPISEPSVPTSPEGEVASEPAGTLSTDRESPLTLPLAENIPAQLEQEAASEIFLAPTEESAAAILSISPEPEVIAEIFPIWIEPEPAVEQESVSTTSSEVAEPEPIVEIAQEPVEQQPIQEIAPLPGEPEAVIEAISVSTEQEQQPAIEIAPASVEQEPVIEVISADSEQKSAIEVISADSEQKPAIAEASSKEIIEAPATASTPDLARQDPAISANASEVALASAEPVLANEEIPPTTPAPEIDPAAELSATEPQAEVDLAPDFFAVASPNEAVSTSEISSAELEVEVVAINEEALKQPAAAESGVAADIAKDRDLEIQSLSQVQEAHTTSSEAYPLLDEASIAPRLIISSPYTTSSFEFLLVDDEITIGRAGASDLYLEQDNLTSRHHALLKRVGERVLIFDKRSHNGVFLNGQRIEVGRGYELADGDHIGIGNYELIFRSAPSGHVSQLI